MVRSLARPWLVPLALLGGLVLPAQGMAAVSVTNVKLQPSTTAGGGHPDLVVDTTFSENPSSDDVKSLRVVLPQGLIADPNAVDVCSQSAFQADNCPASSKIGSAQISAVVTVPPGIDTDQTSPGDLYALQPVGSEVARIGMVVRPPPIGIFSFPKIFLQSGVTVGPDTDFGAVTSFDNLPRQAGSFDIRITEAKLTLNGSGARGPFVTNPTNCRPAGMLVSVTSYDSPGTSNGSASFTPTDCDKLAFAPVLTAAIGGQGLTRKGASPALDSVVTMPRGQANAAGVKVVLPGIVGPNLSALGRACAPDAFAAGNCPSTSQVGTVTASSPFLPGSLVGSLLLVGSTSGLPRVAIVFGGTFPLTLLGDVGIEGGKVTNTFSGLPDLPLSRFELSVSGGNGLLTNLIDLCGPGAGDKLLGTLTAQSGRTAALATPIGVQGCVAGKPSALDKPRASMSIRFSKGQGVLTGHFKAGRGAGRLSNAQLTLAPGLKGARKGLGVSAARKLGRRALGLRGRTLTAKVTGKGAVSLAVRWRGIKASPKVSRRLSPKVPLKFAVLLTDSAGRKTKLRLPVVPKLGR